MLVLHPRVKNASLCASSLRFFFRQVLRVALGIIILAVSFFAASCSKKKSAPPPPAVVEVITITPTNVPLVREWIGTLQGYVNAEIRAQVTGYLMSQDYVEGSEVQKGALLFTIDPRPFEAVLDQTQGNLAQAEAQLTNTELIVRRYTPLAKVSAISQQELDSAVQSNLAAQAAVKSAQAAVETARLNLSFTRITSPIDGLAGVANAQIGDLVGPSGNPLTTVSTIDPIKAVFNVSEQDYIAYRRQYTNAVERVAHEHDLEFHLFLADGSEYPFTGKFFFVGREVSATTGTLQIVALFPNSNYVLRPGQFARVSAQTQIRKNAIVVPQAAVNELQGSYQVTIVDAQDKAEVRPVQVGEQVGPGWIISQGLNAGERVVVEGIQKAKNGMVVKPEPYQPTRETNAPATS